MRFERQGDESVVVKVRTIVEAGTSRGGVLYSSDPIAFLQGVDPERGWVSYVKHQIYSKPFSSRILVFPRGVGSSVGAYVIYRLKRAGRAPNAIINQSSDITTASGCAIAGIPLVDLANGSMAIFEDAKYAVVDSRNSKVKIWK